MRSGRGIAAVVAGIVVLCGCGGVDVSEGLVTEAASSASPSYDGPLKAPTPDWVEEDSPLEGGGAALLTLECSGDPLQAGAAHDLGSTVSQETPEAALQKHLDDNQFWKIAPQRGYRVEKREDERVLFSYDIDGRTRVGMITAEGLEGKDGWTVETFALCDPSEYAERERADLDMKVWSDAQGRAVDTRKVHSAMGPEHCDWQSAEFLTLGEGRDAPSYYRDPEGALAGIDRLHFPYDGDTRLPSDAVDTGWRQDGRELWLAADKKSAYVRVDGGTVERWSGSSERILCM
ncbi:hypothetical protein H9Y04_21625 [Streptomyces sp. TRM66268-LWL]|uniref:Lipoprotein n=1 Tax=Streptomyces polyasparticus TaxID=2767826 RepID=A0ABR7SI11_9ACTN|nr:hypothetical protein [Streptomyces polyasparticus]MBC9715155.1 hypothetical protein [Streptomyces polyasparticus]